MKKILCLLPLVALCIGLLDGCASITVDSQGANMVNVRNSVCLLFYCLPLFSGDPEYPNQDVCSWFENTAHADTNIRLLNEEAERQGARGVRNIASHWDDETIIPFILKQRVYRTSAELIKD